LCLRLSRECRHHLNAIHLCWPTAFLENFTDKWAMTKLLGSRRLEHLFEKQEFWVVLSPLVDPISPAPTTEPLGTLPIICQRSGSLWFAPQHPRQRKDSGFVVQTDQRTSKLSGVAVSGSKKKKRKECCPDLTFPLNLREEADTTAQTRQQHLSDRKIQ
jgi:hypothetical protein